MPLVRLTGPLIAANGGAMQLSTKQATLTGVLNEIRDTNGSLYERIADSQGRPHRFIKVYVDGNYLHSAETMNEPIDEESEITILSAVAGG